MGERIKPWDLFRDKESGLVGELKQEEGNGLYYIDGDHKVAGYWRTASASLGDILKYWKPVNKGIDRNYLGNKKGPEQNFALVFIH